MKIKLWLLDTWHSCSFIIRSICFHHGFHVHLPTGLNLQTIRDPHHETRMDRSRCCFMLVVPLLFAFLPWLPLKCGYFVPEVWFPNHFFKTDTISKDNLINIANQVSFSNSTLQSWFKVKDTILDKFKYNEIKAEFRFYSQKSVCMPRFYTTTSESTWQYSTFLITLNFMLFIYMVVIYAVVYKKATGMKFSTSKSKGSVFNAVAKSVCSPVISPASMSCTTFCIVCFYQPAFCRVCVHTMDFVSAINK